MSKDSNSKKKSSTFYSMNDFLKDLKKMSLNDELEQKTINTFNTINTLDEEFKKKEYESPLQFKSETQNKLKEKRQLINPSQNNYVNEVMKSELKNLSKENAELKFCLNNLNKTYEKEIKDLKLHNMNKSKEIDSTKEIIKKNASLIELLGGKIMNYEKMFKEIELKNEEKSEFDKEIKDKLLNAEKENEELKKDLIERDEIIKSFKDEIDSKKEIFEEIDKMKLDMEAYLKTMDKLYKEIEKKDLIINELKKKMDLLEKKHKEEIENISLKKNNNINNISSNEELLKELTQSKEKQIQLSKELINTQKNYNDEKNNNMKIQKITKEASEMIKKSIDARDKMKEQYDKAIKELIDKYEKQIQYMKLVIVEQNEEFEKKLDDLKKGKNIDDIKGNDKNINSGDDPEKLKQKEYLEKLKKDNTMLIKQNMELKNMNEMLLSKMKDLPDLNNKFNELFETVKLLKEENDLLKKKMKNNKIFQMLNKEHEEDEKEDENENNLNKKNDKIKIKENDDTGDENPKLSVEEIEILENLLKDVENNKGDPETNQKKLELLDNLLKKLESKDEEQHNEEEEENEEEEKNNENLNLKKQLLLQEMLKNLGDPGIEENNEDKKEEEEDKKKNKNDDDSTAKINKKNNINNDEPLKDKNNNINKIYNKKFLKDSPKIIKNTSIKDNKDKKTENENNEKDKMKPEEANEEEEEEEEEENIPNQIIEYFYLYKPTKEGMLSFSLSKKNYSTTIPNKFNEFLKVFDPETSLQYNTLEGLFIIPSNKCNQLYYYSSKKNTISELFSLKENHSGGCLFLDNISKNIIALGGSESKAVEKFSFQTEQLEQLPELSTHRSKITCSQIGNKIYCFFGISKERPNKSIVEYLDLDNIKQGWRELDFENTANFDVISGMSCINLNDNELLIIGGLLNDKIPNEKLLFFNIENKKLTELDKNLPDSEDKIFLFTHNTMFNLFVNGETTSFTSIDNNNQVHVLDDELCYDLYLTPKI